MMRNRRSEERLPLGCRVRLSPLEQDSPPIEDQTAFLGKNISQGGICFSHGHPLKSRRFLMSFHDSKVGDGVVEGEVAWTRTTGSGLHETGCRIVRKLIEPLGLAHAGSAMANA
jgi:hypothetical protein